MDGKEGRVRGGQVNGWSADILRRDRHTTQQLDVQSTSSIYMQTVWQWQKGCNLRPGKIKRAIKLSCDGLLCEKPQPYYSKITGGVVHWLAQWRHSEHPL